MPLTEKWSLKYDRCVKCGRNDIRHGGRGLCLSCYGREKEKKSRGKQRAKYGLASKKLNYKYLVEEYVNKKRSLADIAKECDCSRQFVYKKLKEFNVSLRNYKEASRLAFDKQKVIYSLVDENGNERLIIPNSLKINKLFFKSWSKEMAYVLGVIYTDGNLYHDDRRKTYRITVSQKYPELLNKLLMLMDCNARLRHRKQHGISGELNWFEIQQSQIYSDLINLGLSPRKSKTIEFPDMPLVFRRHFIRGCWDGDGSVHIDQNKINAKYYCGSLNFIEGLVQELYKIGIYKRRPPMDKNEANKMSLNYPDGRFPLKIHQEKRSKSYYIKLDSIENMNKFYYYLYDGVDPEQYLSRKYKVFEHYFGKLNGKIQTQQLNLWN